MADERTRRAIVNLIDREQNHQRMAANYAIRLGQDKTPPIGRRTCAQLQSEMEDWVRYPQTFLPPQVLMHAQLLIRYAQELEGEMGRLLGLHADRAVSYTMLRQPYPPCVEPLSSLKPIRLRDLKIETHHRGRILVVRTLSHAFT